MKKRKKKNRKKKIFIFLFVFVILVVINCVTLSYIIQQYKDNRRQESYDKVMAYEQKVDENGIAVDMLDNPYFMEKMPGYDYPSPKEITYYSSITQTKRHAYVILPIDYDEDKEYPVLYLMHGLHGSHKTWLNKGADIILYNLYYFNDAKEMIVVLPNSEVNEEEDTEGMDIRDTVEVYDKIEDEMINCLMPYIEDNYSVAKGRENTAIAGNSMGGRSTMQIAFKHQELFGYVGAFSSANVIGKQEYGHVVHPVLDDVKIDENAGNFKMIMLMVGRSDDVCGSCTYELHNRMVENGIDHIFYETEGGHQNTVWQNALYNFGQRLFK